MTSTNDDVSKTPIQQISVSNENDSRAVIPEEIPLASAPVARENTKPVPKMPDGVGVEFGNFARTNEQGIVEVIDIETGEIIAKQASYEDLFKSKRDRLVEVEMPDGKRAYIEKGLPLNAVTRTNKNLYQYTEMWGDLICERVAAGSTLKNLGKEPGFPPLSIIQKWRRDHENFREKLAFAEKARGDIFHDEIVELTRDKSLEPQERRSMIDGNKWLAEKNDPEKFGPKMKVSGDPNAPLGFIIETGIRRPTDEGFEEIDVTPNALSGAKLDEK